MADYSDNGEVVTDDVVASVDPGAPLFLGTLLFCVSSLLALPIFVAIGNRRARLRRASASKPKRWLDLPTSREELQHREQVDSYNLDVLSSGITSFDEVSADGCYGGCNAFEEMLEVGDMDDGVCCFTMSDNQLTSIFNEENEEPDNFVQEQHPSPTNSIRKRKSTDDITCSSGCDKSKRTRRHISHDASYVRVPKRLSFSVGSDHGQQVNVNSGTPSPKRRGKILKTQPIRPLSQTPTIPKKSILDGGFYAGSNLRLHHQVLQSQLDREHRADMKRKRKKAKLAKSYVPPSIPSTNLDLDRGGSFEHVIVQTTISSNVHNDKVVSDLDIVFGPQSPYHRNKRKEIWDQFVRIAKFDHESKRLVTVMAPYTCTALICNMFALIDIYIISAGLGAVSLSAFLVAGYFLSMVYNAAKGFTDAQATLCAHAVGAGNYFLAGQYIQLTQIVFVLTGFLPLLLMSSFMYNILVWLDVSSDVATLGGSFATVQVIAILIGGFNDAQMQFLSAIDPSMYSNGIEIMMHASSTAALYAYLIYNRNDATLVDLAWMKCCVALLFIPINITVLSARGWLDLCWVGMARSNALKNREAVKQMLKTGIPLGIGSLIRESEWVVLVLFASFIGTDDVATYAVVRRTSDIFSSLIEGLCCGAELRCAYHMGRGNLVDASRSAYKSLLIGISVGTALAFAFYGVLGDFIFKLLDYDKIGAEMTQLIPLLCLCNIVMTIGMLGWALLGAQGRVRRAMFVSMVTTWIVTIPIAAYFVLVRNYNLQGLVAAVTLGYSVSSTIILYLLVRSNWKKRSEKVMRTTSFKASSFSDDESTIGSITSINDITAPVPEPPMLRLQ